MTDSGWRKRQIALDKKAENARELGLDYEPDKTSEQKRPQNCGTGYCSCIECVMEPEQEPVGRFAKFTDGIWREVTAGSAGVQLFTAPPQRTWVGLTKTEVGNHLRRHAFGDQPTFRQGFREGVAFAEAKLRSKNT